MRHSAPRFRRTILVLFIVYTLVMLWLLFGQRIGPLPETSDYLQTVFRRVNLIPFVTISEFAAAPARGIVSSHAVINLAGNILMFIPLGAALPTLWARFRGFWHCMGYTALIILTVELVQLLTLLGSADIDDLILNLAGIAMGYGSFALLKKRKPELF